MRFLQFAANFITRIRLYSGSRLNIGGCNRLDDSWKSWLPKDVHPELMKPRAFGCVTGNPLLVFPEAPVGIARTINRDNPSGCVYGPPRNMRARIR